MCIPANIQIYLYRKSALIAALLIVVFLYGSDSLVFTYISSFRIHL